VRNAVPAPVTAAETFDVVIFPVRGVLGHADALQLPLPAEIIVAEKATEAVAIESKRINAPDLKACKDSLISYWYLLVD
ncbi:MAG: hypothetical protein Q8939_04830, partial [Bacteroidota bacterium]|nr:hypothetical protein [Bacteroidota bacterium]